ncbi:MAG: spermidine/putrescine transporter ATP-binding protein [Bacillales bacterium]|jgi:ABC-type Fe3+/spermidine/putrescine transport system ATPase subunit|nr:spermidine/putrescine transporter ATP-binding protein [Bacillales bacterium]
MENVRIEAINLVLDGKQILKDVNLTVSAGESFSILGESGSGKTSILKLITGEFTPSSGEIFFGEQKMNAISMEKRDGVLISPGDTLFPHMSVIENLTFAPRMKGLKKEVIAEKANQLLEFVGMQGFEKRYPSSLSSGQKQRVAIARGLMVEPKVLLLDEAFSNLDRHLKKEMHDMVNDLRCHLQFTLIVVTHDLEEAIRLGDNIGILNHGRLIKGNSIEDLIQNSKEAQEFLKVFALDQEMKIKKVFDILKQV